MSNINNTSIKYNLIFINSFSVWGDSNTVWTPIEIMLLLLRLLLSYTHAGIHQIGNDDLNIKFSNCFSKHESQLICKTLYRWYMSTAKEINIWEKQYNILPAFYLISKYGTIMNKNSLTSMDLVAFAVQTQSTR